MRELVGAMQESVEILVRPLGFPIEPPVLRALAAGGADVAVAGASIVGADRIAARTAQHLVERLVAHFAVQIPERDVERRGGARLNARAAPAEVAGEAARERLHLERIASQHARRYIFVQVRLDALRGVTRLAQAAYPLIG